MSNKNLKAFEQMQRLTKEARKFYGDNYNPGTLYPPRDAKFLLDEEYIPFDFDTDYDDPLYKEYRRIRMLKNPYEDLYEPQTTKDVENDIQYTVSQPTSYAQQNIDTSEPYLEFDGNNLRWIENDAEKYKWKAMSGAADYQDRIYQDRVGKGPLPEGEWHVKQNQLQHYDDISGFQKVLGRFEAGQWPKGTSSWGNHRVWLEPTETTNTYGRGNLAIHGGKTFGSNGCIDLESGMDDFNNKYTTYGKDMKLKVKYPNKF